MAGSGQPPNPSGQGNWSGPPPAAPAPGGFQVKPVEAGPAPGIAYADLAIRIGAYIIDGVILAVAWFILAAIAGAIFFTSLFSVGFAMALIVTLILGGVYFVGTAVYFIYCWTRLRASLGQKMLGLETVSSANGGTLTQPQAIRRWAFLFGPQAVAIVLQFAAGWFAFSFGAMSILSMLISLASLAYAIYLLYSVTQSSKRQGFHDVQASTVVIKRLVA